MDRQWARISATGRNLSSRDLNCHINAHSRNLGKYWDKVLLNVSAGYHRKTRSEYRSSPLSNAVLCALEQWNTHITAKNWERIANSTPVGSFTDAALTTQPAHT